ncbi:MAG: hypothetical protein K8T26_00565 [Lentisphaerae bacterium]|nr:hypothetical protein [Lentisphaerota bacterium]
MNRYRPDFRDLLEGFDLPTLERDPSTIFALSPDLKLIYVNPAWCMFAARNDGEPELSRHYHLDTPVADAMCGPLREFCLQAFQKALCTGTPWHYDYECSSAEHYRMYHQTAYPLPLRRGLLVVNSLVREHVHVDRKPVSTGSTTNHYRTKDGLITQCAHCRRVQRPSRPAVWDWIPAWVSHMPPNTTGGICPLCFAHYWKPHVKAKRAAAPDLAHV